MADNKLTLVKIHLRELKVTSQNCSYFVLWKYDKAAEVRSSAKPALAGSVIFNDVLEARVGFQPAQSGQGLIESMSSLVIYCVQESGTQRVSGVVCFNLSQCLHRNQHFQERQFQYAKGKDDTLKVCVEISYNEEKSSQFSEMMLETQMRKNSKFAQKLGYRDASLIRLKQKQISEHRLADKELSRLEKRLQQTEKELSQCRTKFQSVQAAVRRTQAELELSEGKNCDGAESYQLNQNQNKEQPQNDIGIKKNLDERVKEGQEKGSKKSQDQAQSKDKLKERLLDLLQAQRFQQRKLDILLELKTYLVSELNYFKLSKQTSFQDVINKRLCSEQVYHQRVLRQLLKTTQVAVHRQSVLQILQSAIKDKSAQCQGLFEQNQKLKVRVAQVEGKWKQSREQMDRVSKLLSVRDQRIEGLQLELAARKQRQSKKPDQCRLFTEKNKMLLKIQSRNTQFRIVEQLNNSLAKQLDSLREQNIRLRQQLEHKARTDWGLAQQLAQLKQTLREKDYQMAQSKMACSLQKSLILKDKQKQMADYKFSSELDKAQFQKQLFRVFQKLKLKPRGNSIADLLQLSVEISKMKDQAKTKQQSLLRRINEQQAVIQSAEDQIGKLRRQQLQWQQSQSQRVQAQAQWVARMRGD